MYEVVMVGLGLVPLALATVWYVLRLFDRALANGKFGREHMRSLQSNPVALAIYLGLRYLGTAVLVMGLYASIL